MCPPVYHHNGFVATHALRYMMYGTSCPYIMCPSAHDIYIYILHVYFVVVVTGCSFT